MARNHQVIVKLSSEELKRVEDKSVRLGMPISTFLRVLGLTANISNTK